MPIAEFNFGTLRYDWGDPRLSGFADNIAGVNKIAQRSDGFIWMIDNDTMDAVQSDPNGALKDRPNTASTLSVWRDAHSLWHFVEKTFHAKIMAQHDDWFVPGDRGHLVIWHVADGHLPTVAEGMAQWQKLQTHGDTAEIFGGARLRALAKGD